MRRPAIECPCIHLISSRVYSITFLIIAANGKTREPPPGMRLGLANSSRIILFDRFHRSVGKLCKRYGHPEPLSFFHDITDCFFNLRLFVGQYVLQHRREDMRAAATSDRGAYSVNHLHGVVKWRIPPQLYVEEAPRRVS